MQIIPRSAWANPSRPYRLRPVLWPDAPTAVVHHTAAPTPSEHAELRQDIGEVRAIDNFHYLTRGWAGGVGYAYLVFPSGRVFEGRGERHGAHAGPEWNHLPGVCMVGTWSHAYPGERQLDALAWLLRVHLRVGGVRGHRDVMRTSCPGAVLYTALEHILSRTLFDETVYLPPHGNTLRLHWMDKNGLKRVAAGWQGVETAMLWFRTHRFEGAHMAISWRGSVWSGWRDVAHVWNHLSVKYLGKEFLWPR